MKNFVSKYGRATTILVALAIVGLLLLAIGIAGSGYPIVAVAVLFLSFGLIGMLVRIQQTLQERFVQMRTSMQSSTRSQTAMIRSDIRSLGEVAAARPQVAPTPSKVAKPIGSSFAETPLLWGVGPEFEYGVRARSNPSAFEGFALRSKSIRMRDSLARSATNLQYGLRDMLMILVSLRAGLLKNGGSERIREWDATALLGVAKVMANQRSEPLDLENAAMIFAQVKRIWGPEALTKTDRYLYLETLQMLGSFGEAERNSREFGLVRRDPVQVGLMRSNRVVADPSFEEERESKWLDSVNAVLAIDGLDPIGLIDGETNRIDRIASRSTARSVDGPRVTVLMPTFNGSQFLGTALRSMAEQTWTNLEVIVIDDCSDEREQSEVSRIVGQFEFAVLIKQERNGGAYLARNRGLEVATGEYITVHDADDWSHAQKIEIQVRHLLENPEEVGNLSRHSRATEDLWFLRINNNPSFSQPNFSSLMVHRSVFDEIGLWDAVNRGADAEFRDRLVTRAGRPIPVVGSTPASFTRTRTGSLTDGELGRGYVDASRLFYMASYQRAHEVAASERTGSDWAPLTFARPLNMDPVARGSHFGTFDVVFATDFRFPGGTTSLAMQEIRAAVSGGLRVGIIQMESPLNLGARAKISEKLLDLVVELDVSILSLKDRATIKLLIVRHPSVVQFLDGASSNLEVESSYLVVNTPPVLNGGGGSGFSMVECIETLRQLIGVSPQLVPESGVTRNLSERLVGKGAFAPFDWPGFVDVNDFKVKETDFSEKPVVGRHSRDNLDKWPDTRKEFEQAYDRPETFDTVILGGVKSIQGRIRPATWSRVRVHEFGSVEPKAFLEGVDFWVYAHSTKWTESFGMAAVEAMASGLVVILPPYMEQTFGDAAIYAEPPAIEGLVARYWSDPELYRQQASIARERAESLFSSEAYVSRLQARLRLTNVTAE